MSLSEIGRVLEISRERVGDIKSNALRKIRATPWAKNKFKEMFKEKQYKSNYTISDLIERISFSSKYLSDGIL